MDLHTVGHVGGPQGPPRLQRVPRLNALKPTTAPFTPPSQYGQAGRVRPPPRPAPGGHFGQRRQTFIRPKATATQPVTASLRPGDLIEWQKDKGRSALGLISSQDGKKNFWVIDAETGRKTSILPKQVLLHFPGPYNNDQAQSMAAEGAAAEQAVASSQAPPAAEGGAPQASTPLADAWEMAVADSIACLTLPELAGLVLDDDSPRNLYRMYRMLSADRLYFRQLGGKQTSELPAYAPKPADAVVAAQKAMVEEAAAARDKEAWSVAVKAALAAKKRSEQPSEEEWSTGAHARRISALKRLALEGVAALDAPVLTLAQESLSVVGISTKAAAAAAGGNNSYPNDPNSILSDAAAGLLVDVRALRQHEPIAAMRRGVVLGFPAAIEAEAASLLAAPPADACASVRMDLTHLRCYTIDDASTLEVDDGMSVELVDGGSLTEPVALPRTRVWVHVADPTRWLAPGMSEGLMGEARTRLRTLYFPWGNAPMFPRALAEGPFSLKGGEVCDALSISAEVQEDGTLGAVQVVPSRVRVTHKLTYDAADALMERAASGASASTSGSTSGAGEAGAGELADLAVLRAVARARRAYREECGAIEIPLPEAKVGVPHDDLDAARPRVTIERVSQWESASRGTVAELMILAGEAAGLIGKRAALPLPYRNQPQPTLPSPGELEVLPEGPCRGYALRRCMTRSGVAPAPARHASLGLDVYVQVTSPIRRYPDVIAHANLKALALGLPPPFTRGDIDALANAMASDKAREAGAAERAEEQYWISEHFRQRKGQEWAATVLGWQRQDLKLASVLLDELGYETVVKVDADTVAPGDYVTLAVLEAVPATGLLRFYVTSHTPRNPPPEEDGEEGDTFPADDDELPAAPAAARSWHNDSPSLVQSGAGGVVAGVMGALAGLVGAGHGQASEDRAHDGHDAHAHHEAAGHHQSDHDAQQQSEESKQEHSSHSDDGHSNHHHDHDDHHHEQGDDTQPVQDQGTEQEAAAADADDSAAGGDGGDSGGGGADE